MCDGLGRVSEGKDGTGLWVLLGKDCTEAWGALSAWTGFWGQKNLKAPSIEVGGLIYPHLMARGADKSGSHTREPLTSSAVVIRVKGDKKTR